MGMHRRDSRPSSGIGRRSTGIAPGRACASLDLMQGGVTRLENGRTLQRASIRSGHESCRQVRFSRGSPLLDLGLRPPPPVRRCGRSGRERRTRDSRSDRPGDAPCRVGCRTRADGEPTPALQPPAQESRRHPSEDVSLHVSPPQCDRHTSISDTQPWQTRPCSNRGARRAARAPRAPNARMEIGSVDGDSPVCPGSLDLSPT